MTRPSDSLVARAFSRIDPSSLPTRSGTFVNGEDPEAIANRCREVTAGLCGVLEQSGIDACEVYLFVDHRQHEVELTHALEIWRREAEVVGTWGHVVLGVPGRRGANPAQLEGPRGVVELWDWTARQYDVTVEVPHLVDLGDWGPYEPPRRPVCRRTAHRNDRTRASNCLLPDPLLQRYLRSRGRSQLPPVGRGVYRNATPSHGLGAIPVGRTEPQR